VASWTDSELILLAKLSNAAYEPDARPMVTSLGCQFVDQFGGEQCQVTLAKWADRAVIIFQGTRVGKNPDIAELWDDVDSTPTSVDGCDVHRGFWDPLLALWPDIEAKLPATGPRLITGHSLGGVRAHLAKHLCPEADVVSFGAPKGASAKFWYQVYQGEPPTRVVHEQDFAPTWPPLLYSQPGDQLWLHNGEMISVTHRYGLCTSVADHSIDRGYIPALEHLMAPALV
jgi:hypothetical protein